MNIMYLWRYLWKKKWLILIPTVAAVLLAWWFSRNNAAEYTSTAQLSTGYMDVNPLDYNTRNSNNAALFNNVIQTLKSNQVLDLVSYDLLLHDLQSSTPFWSEEASDAMDFVSRYPGGKEGLIKALSNKIDSLSVLNLSRKDDRTIRALANQRGYSPDAILGKTLINRIESSDFILITSTTSDPELSAFMANDICQKFLGLYQSTLGRASATSLDTLRSMMNTKRQMLDNKLSLLQTDDGADFTGSVGMLGSLRTQLTQQENNLIASQVALDHINRQLEASDQQDGLVAENEDILALRKNIDQLYTRYVDDGSKDAGLLQQIDHLRDNLQQKLSAVRGAGSGGVPIGDLIKEKMNLEVQINVAQETKKDLQNKIRTLTGAVQTSSTRQRMTEEIQGEIELARQQYQEANKLYNEALNRNKFPGNNFRQVLQASPPLAANPSEKIKIMGFAGFGVFFFAIFLFLFLEFIDPSIKTPSYLKAQLSFPLLAHLRRVPAKHPEALLRKDAPAKASYRGFKEQVKQLRYEVEHQEGRIVLVTGYHAKSGRTTLIECLAESLSMSNRKVLLIDANFHNNTLTRKYSAQEAVEDFIAPKEQTKVNDAITALTVPGGQDNIQVIGCRSGDYTPQEVLAERNIFTSLKDDENYDFVFIDCAALNLGPDSKELLPYAEAVILNFAANQPFAEGDQNFKKFLEKNKIPVLGAVLNKVPSYSMNL